MAENGMRLRSSQKAKRTFNPIRAIVDNLKPPQNHPKKLLNLALGDPTAYGNLHCPEVLMDGVRESLE
jgi:tyrosine aminotransferase